MVLLFLAVIMSCCHYILVLLYHGVIMPWCHRVLVSLCHGLIKSCCNYGMVPLYLAVICHGVIIVWCNYIMVSFPQIQEHGILRSLQCSLCHGVVVKMVLHMGTTFSHRGCCKFLLIVSRQRSQQTLAMYVM